MLRTKRQRNQALDAFSAWRKAGHDYIITADDAWSLTDGVVGQKDSNEEMRLIDVAVQLIKRKENK